MINYVFSFQQTFENGLHIKWLLMLMMIKNSIMPYNNSNIEVDHNNQITYQDFYNNSLAIYIFNSSLSIFLLIFEIIFVRISK